MLYIKQHTRNVIHKITCIQYVNLKEHRIECNTQTKYSNYYVYLQSNTTSEPLFWVKAHVSN